MLTIGSMVYLKEGREKIMILNRGPIISLNEELKTFDYSGCIYPVGLIPDQTLYFNEEKH